MTTPATLTMSLEDYEALVALARRGVVTPEQATALQTFLRSLEAANGFTRSSLWIQWQEQDQPVPPTTRFPAVWPPELRYFLELTSRPISRVDVDKVIAVKARKPTNILVTSDPAALVGWTKVADYFVQ